jgi:hypothetical protein
MTCPILVPLLDALADRRRGLPGLFAEKFALGEARDHEPDVDAVQQRAGELGVVGLQTVLSARATADDVPREAARARVRGGDEREPRGEHHRAHHPRDDHAPVLERLSQAFDRVAAELRELVEEQHPVVRQRS